MLLTLILAGAVAVPLPKSGHCPANYRSEAAYCVPANDKAPVAVPKVGQCPSTMIQSGSYCIQPHRGY